MEVYIEQYLEEDEYIGYMWRVVLKTGKIKKDKFRTYTEAVGWVKLMGYIEVPMY